LRSYHSVTNRVLTGADAPLRARRTVERELAQADLVEAERRLMRAGNILSLASFWLAVSNVPKAAVPWGGVRRYRPQNCSVRGCLAVAQIEFPERFLAIEREGIGSVLGMPLLRGGNRTRSHRRPAHKGAALLGKANRSLKTFADQEAQP
jgi:hypothetical protein